MDIKALYEEFLPRDEIKDILKSYFLKGYTDNVYEIMSDIFEEKFNKIFFVLFPEEINDARVLQYIHKHPYNQPTEIHFFPAIQNLTEKALIWRNNNKEYQHFLFDSILESPSSKTLLRDVGIDLDSENITKKELFKKLDNWFSKLPIQNRYRNTVRQNPLSYRISHRDYLLLLSEFLNIIKQIIDLPENIFSIILGNHKLNRELAECFFIKETKDTWHKGTCSFVLRVLNECFNLNVKTWQDLIEDPNYIKIVNALEEIRSKANTKEDEITEKIGFRRFEICKKIIVHTKIDMTPKELAMRYSYFNNNEKCAAYCRSEKNDKFGIYAIIDYYYTEDTLVHECIHALSHNYSTNNLGYLLKNNMWLNEVVTQFLTLRAMANARSTKLYPYNPCAYTNGCYIIWDFLVKYEDLLREDFMGINSLFLDSVGEDNFLHLADLLKTFFNKFNVNTICTYIKQYNGLELNNIKEILDHRDELEGHNISNLDALFNHIDEIKNFTNTIMSNSNQNVANKRSI